MAATRAIAACDMAKVAYTVHEYIHDPRAASYGLEVELAAADLAALTGAHVGPIAR